MPSQGVTSSSHCPKIVVPIYVLLFFDARRYVRYRRKWCLRNQKEKSSWGSVFGRRVSREWSGFNTQDTIDCEIGRHYSAVHFSSMQCSAVQFISAQCSAVQCSAVQCSAPAVPLSCHLTMMYMCKCEHQVRVDGALHTATISLRWPRARNGNGHALHSVLYKKPQNRPIPTVVG